MHKTLSCSRIPRCLRTPRWKKAAAAEAATCLGRSALAAGVMSDNEKINHQLREPGSRPTTPVPGGRGRCSSGPERECRVGGGAAKGGGAEFGALCTPKRDTSIEAAQQKSPETRNRRSKGALRETNIISGGKGSRPVNEARWVKRGYSAAATPADCRWWRLFVFWARLAPMRAAVFVSNKDVHLRERRRATESFD